MAAPAGSRAASGSSLGFSIPHSSLLLEVLATTWLWVIGRRLFQESWLSLRPPRKHSNSLLADKNLKILSYQINVAKLWNGNSNALLVEEYICTGFGKG
jgi:hypothetical protein